jgi:hypothetical protein
VPAGARFCEACGSDVAASGSERPASRPPGSPLTPHAEKEFEKPVAAAQFRQTATQSDPAAPTEARPRNKSGSISDGPLDLRHIPTDQPARLKRSGQPAWVVTAAPWQWALAIVSGAVFLYNMSFVITAGLLWLRKAPLAAGLTSRLGVYGALAAGACCGLAVALPDAKTSLTVIFGGLLMRSLVGIALVSSAGRGAAPLIWLGICGLSAGVLWWLWFDQPRERSDASRMSMALTVLASSEALSAVYGYSTHPSLIQVRQLATLAIIIGALLFLRVWIPGAMGDGAPPARRR